MPNTTNNHLDNDKELREALFQVHYGEEITSGDLRSMEHTPQAWRGFFEIETFVKEYTQSKLKAFAGEVDQARRVIEAYIDDEECSFDHHGYCQTHNLNEVDQRCVNIVAKESVETLKAIKERWNVK